MHPIYTLFSKILTSHTAKLLILLIIVIVVVVVVQFHLINLTLACFSKRVNGQYNISIIIDNRLGEHTIIVRL